MSNSERNIENKPGVTIQVALPCEARPIIDHFRLKRLGSSVFAKYQNADASLALIVSGVGKLNAATALAYSLSSLHYPEHQGFLNVGIVGSSQFSVGDCVMAHKVVDTATQHVWYPFLMKRGITPTADLLCYDQPQSTYQAPLMDMESAGFMHTISRLGCQDQAQLIKIVSDTVAQDQSSIVPAQVVRWVSNHLGVIDHVVTDLLQRSALASQSQVVLHDYDQLLERWHFTVYQQHQLKSLLRRWQVVMTDKPIWQYLVECTDASTAIRILQEALVNASYRFG